MARTYKDSGIPWIGEIPQEWGIYRIKYNTFLKGRIGWQGLNSNDFLDEGYCLITGTDFDNKGGINWDTCYRISKERFDEDELLHIKCGDLLMTKDGTVGKMAYIKYLPEEASLNSHLLIIRQLSKLMDNAFLYWVMLSPVFKEFCAIYQAGSIMSSISQSTLGLFSCQLPPLSKQQRIAEFLDRKCEEIDELIGLQGEFIEELKAYKQSLITETVTRGLNHNAKLKPSGIDWIGEIPEGWGIAKLKYYISVKSGDAIENKMISDSGQYPVFGGGEMIGFTSKYNSSKNDLLIGRVGARCGCVTMPLCNSWATDNALILNTTICLSYMYYLLVGCDLNKQNTSNAQPLITATKIKNTVVPVPPLSEQQQIADYLDSKCSEIDSLIAIKQQKIEELKDYKKSIIYEYVTGKREIK